MGLGKRSMGDARITDGGAVEQYQKKKLIRLFCFTGMMMGLGKRSPNSISDGGGCLELRIELEFRFPTFHNVELY